MLYSLQTGRLGVQCGGFDEVQDILPSHIRELRGWTISSFMYRIPYANDADQM